MCGLLLAGPLGGMTKNVTDRKGKCQCLGAGEGSGKSTPGPWGVIRRGDKELK